MTYDDALARYRDWRNVSPDCETVAVITAILAHFAPAQPICTWCLRPANNHDARCYLASSANRGALSDTHPHGIHIP